MTSDDTTMRGLWLEDGDARLRTDLPVPEPAPGEVRVRITCAGICGTDLELSRGYAGFVGIPGHEMVGTVDAGPAEWLGRRVVADINFGCGECEECQRGGSRHCSRRRVLGIRDAHGALADWTVLPAANLVAVPDGIDDDLAVFAEPVAAACRVAEQIAELEHPHQSPVAVLGAGRLGQLVARVLARRDRTVCLWGRSVSSLESARAAGIEARASAELKASSVDLLVDCSGNPEGFQTALAALRPRGTLLLKSTFAPSGSFDPSPIVVDELTVLGSRCGAIDRGLAELVAGLDPRDLIAERYELAEAEAAFAAAPTAAGRKILVLP